MRLKIVDGLSAAYNYLTQMMMVISDFGRAVVLAFPDVVTVTVYRMWLNSREPAHWFPL